jgi:hypothetical protein
MRTVSTRLYTCGFELNEQELRRIHDVANQQMKRALAEKEYEAIYEVRYQNGAIAEPRKLDGLFDEENWGSSAIRSVQMRFSAETSPSKTLIQIGFIDANFNGTDASIRYLIEGEDRDWVFVASSQLSERIARIQRFNYAGLFGSRYFLPLAFLSILLIAVGITTSVDRPSRQVRARLMAETRAAWKKGELKDPIEAVLRIEDAVAQGDAEFNPLARLVPMLLLPVCVIPLTPIASRLLPPFNFVWGESQKAFDKRRGRTRFVFVGVVLAILLGLFSNFLSKKLGW